MGWPIQIEIQISIIFQRTPLKKNIFQRINHGTHLPFMHVVSYVLEKILNC